MIRSRAVAVAAAVPPLRSILLRALHSTASTSAEARQAPPPRPRLSFPNTRNRPQFDDHVPEKGYTPPSTDRRLAPLRRVKRDPYDEFGSSSPSQLRQELEGEEQEEDPDFIDEPEHKPRFGFVYHPRAQPFKPNTYPVPESALSEEQAQPGTFGSFSLHPGLVESMQDRFGTSGETTYIQSLAFSHLCPTPPPASRTLLGAETGSGKTYAYLLPVMNNLKATEPENATPEQHPKDRRCLPGAIVLQPTHELTRQSTAMAKRMVHEIKLSVAGMSNSITGGVKGKGGAVDILFGTGAMTRRMMGIRKPGEETEEGYNARPHVGMDRVDWLVIDEADVLLSRDFRAETLLMIQHVLKARPNTHIILCTATFPPSLLNLLTTHETLSQLPFTHLLSPKLHKLPRNLEARFVPRSRGDLFSDVVHEVRRVQTEDAIRRNHIIAAGNEVDRSKMIIFCNLDSRVQKLSEVLEAKGHPNLTWTKEGANRRHGSSGALKQFLMDPKESVEEALNPKLKVSKRNEKSEDNEDKPEEPRILITTGILSRGLDFSPLVSTVFLVDQPKDILDFMHRAGRAGRAGRKGRVVIFGWTQGKQAEDGALGSTIRKFIRDGEKDQSAQWAEARQARLHDYRARRKEYEEKHARREGLPIKKDDVSISGRGREIKRPSVGFAREAPGFKSVQSTMRRERLVNRFGAEHVTARGEIKGVGRTKFRGQGNTHGVRRGPHGGRRG